jgi:homogentisate 1,2-dioxygenase
MRSLRLHGFKTKPEKDHLAARKTMLVNSDCAIVLAAPQAKERGLLLQERRLR